MALVLSENSQVNEAKARLMVVEQQKERKKATVRRVSTFSYFFRNITIFNIFKSYSIHIPKLAL